MWRLARSWLTSAAGARSFRWNESVVAGGASPSCITPGTRPAGPATTSARKTFSRTGWASAARAWMTSSSDIQRYYQNTRTISSPMVAEAAARVGLRPDRLQRLGQARAGLRQLALLDGRHRVVV